MFQNCLQSGHGEDGNPGRYPRTQKVTVLERIIAEDAQHSFSRLVTSMVELQDGLVSSILDLPILGSPNMWAVLTVEMNMV